MTRPLVFGLLATLSIFSPVAFASGIQCNSPGGKEVIEVTPEKSTGLDAVLVAYTTDGLKLTYNLPEQGTPPSVYRYSALGGGYAEDFTSFSFSGKELTIENPPGDFGYIIEQGTHRYYFWLTDYSSHRLILSNIHIPDTADCSSVTLDPVGSGEPIHYYSVNGRRLTLDQEITLSYLNLEWNDESQTWSQVTAEKSLESLTSDILVSPAPYCDTYFRLTGDRFLRRWGEEVSCESGNFVTSAVDVRTFAEQIKTDADNSNQIGGNDDTLGGSAPANIRFTAYVTDAVRHTEWQLAADPDFEDIRYRFSEQDVDYEFMEEGTWYMRFIGSNSDGSCTSEGETFTIAIGASELHCPNAFSPGASEGVNDIWRVSYKSIVKFKCWIFDRYGTQLYYFDSPDGGWDGKYRGKYVKSGVYFYVIEAVGAEGKKYKKSGDINILGLKYNGTSSGTTDSGVTN